jgi:hypothetical protein
MVTCPHFQIKRQICKKRFRYFLFVCYVVQTAGKSKKEDWGNKGRKMAGDKVTRCGLLGRQALGKAYSGKLRPWGGDHATGTEF